MTSGITTHRDGAVLEITLNRPKVNAIDAATSRVIGETFCRFRDDPSLKVAIITAAGERIFSAGWDLKALERGEETLDTWRDIDYGPGGFGGLSELWDLNKPVIAAINGHAIGGGFELALASDLIISAEHAEFALPELPLGMVPDAGPIQRLPRRLPYNIALEMIYLGRRMSAQEAAQHGLVNKVVPGVELMTTARDWAKRLAAIPSATLQAVKEILRELESRSIQQGFETIRTAPLPMYAASLACGESEEGVSAFFERRNPEFKG